MSTRGSECLDESSRALGKVSVFAKVRESWGRSQCLGQKSERLGKSCRVFANVRESGGSLENLDGRS